MFSTLMLFAAVLDNDIRRLFVAWADQCGVSLFEAAERGRKAVVRTLEARRCVGYEHFFAKTSTVGLGRRKGIGLRRRRATRHVVPGRRNAVGVGAKREDAASAGTTGDKGTSEKTCCDSIFHIEPLWEKMGPNLWFI